MRLSMHVTTASRRPGSRRADRRASRDVALVGTEQSGDSVLHPPIVACRRSGHADLRLRDGRRLPRAFSTLASRAAIRSTTLAGRLLGRLLLDDLLAGVLGLDALAQLLGEGVVVAASGSSRSPARRAAGSPSSASWCPASPAAAARRCRRGARPRRRSASSTSPARRRAGGSPSGTACCASPRCRWRPADAPPSPPAAAGTPSCRVAVGHQPVGALVVDRVDLVEGDEVGHLDRAGRLRLQLAQLVLVERDVATLARSRSPSRCRRCRPPCRTSRRPCGCGCATPTSSPAGGSGRRDRGRRCTPSRGR